MPEWLGTRLEAKVEEEVMAKEKVIRAPSGEEECPVGGEYKWRDVSFLTDNVLQPLFGATMSLTLPWPQHRRLLLIGGPMIAAVMSPTLCCWC